MKRRKDLSRKIEQRKKDVRKKKENLKERYEEKENGKGSKRVEGSWAEFIKFE